MKKKNIFLVTTLVLSIICIPAVTFADVPPSGLQLPIVQFPIKLLLTILIETIVIFTLFQTIYRKQNIKANKLFMTGIVPSLITLPTFYIFDYIFFSLIYPVPTLYDWYANNYQEIPYNDNYKIIFIAISEILIFVFEAFLISRLLKVSKKQGMIISFIANVTSFFVGSFLIRMLE